jgi:vancomycin resistance protein YoaR
LKTTQRAHAEFGTGRLFRERRRRRWVVGLLSLALAAFAALAVLLESGADFFGTIHVGGVIVSRDQAGVSALTTHAARWAQAPVTIHVGPYLAHATRGALGAQLSVAAVQARLLGLGRTGNVVRDIGDFWTSRRGTLQLPWHVDIARDALSACMEDMRRKLERPPVPGALLADGSVLPGTPGLTINLLRVIEQMREGLSAGATDITVDALRIAPPDPVRYISGALNPGQFAEVLSQFETKYRTSGSAAGRARNIELAVQAIDGAVLEPGGELSFNEKVGERSYERGFETAKELSNRRVVDGVGGGVCQVAATLHAAAFLAGFALPEYRPHSRPARYIEVGLDTMVAWPSQDLRIGNVYPFPVRLRLTAHDGSLLVRLEGSGKAHPVEWSKEIVQRITAGVQRIDDPTLATGYTQLLQESIDGLVLHRRRTIYFPTGPSVEDVTLRYPPNDRIIAVGAGGTRTTSEQSAARALEMNDF